MASSPFFSLNCGKRLRITAGTDTKDARVLLGDEDITHAIKSLCLEMKVGHLNRVFVEFLTSAVEVDAGVEVEAVGSEQADARDA